MSRTLSCTALADFPIVAPGDDLAALIQQSLNQQCEPQDGDVIVIAQKVVSKAEGRYFKLSEVAASDAAHALAAQADKDPALAQLILDESKEVVRVRPGVVIVEHKLGYVHANAGIDRSNVRDGDNEVLLLPVDSDASAKQIKQHLKVTLNVDVAVIINDSAGRAWRNGTCGMVIGSAGLVPLVDMVGEADMQGRTMEVTTVAVADELAAAASYMMGQGAEGCPVVLIRGADWQASDEGSGSLIRDKSMDLFR